MTNKHIGAYTIVSMEDQGTQETTQSQGIGFPGSVPTNPQVNNKKNWKWLIVLVLFLIVIGAVTFLVFKNSRSGSISESPTPESEKLSNIATPEVTTTPIASPVDKKQIKIKVLNGTGVAGDAGLLSDVLKKLGYNTISTGNADNQSSAANTEVIFGSSVGNDVVSEITAKLKEIYTNVTTKSSSLSDVDIQITTGSRKDSTPKATTPSTPSVTASPSATPAQ